MCDFPTVNPTGTAQLPKQQAYVAPLLLLPSRRQASNTKSPLTVSSSSVSATAGSLGVQVLRSFELDVDVAGESDMIPLATNSQTLLLNHQHYQVHALSPFNHGFVIGSVE